MASKPPSEKKSRRPLTLHVSALSGAEYSAYTDWLSEIVGPLDGVRDTPDHHEDGGQFGNDASLDNKDKIVSRTRISDGNWDPEKTLISVREARGWIRGRWGNGLRPLDGAVIDSILKNFSPNLAAQDVITGGQFFAVMRLICHAQEQSQNLQDGKTVIDDSLVFVQANPNYMPIESPTVSHQKASSVSSVLSDFSSSVSSKKPKPPPPPPVPPTRQLSEISLTQVQPVVPYESNGTSNAPALPPRMPSSAVNISPNSNPFTRFTVPNLPTSDTTVPTIKNASSSALAPSRNPFKPIKPPPPRPPFPLVSQSSTTPSESDESSSPPSKRPTTTPNAPLPPLPPRKTALLPPPRHASIKHAAPPQPTPTTAYVLPPLPPPAPPPKPPKVTSPLIKQSLEAAKSAQSLKASLDNLGRERQLQVIKKSGSVTTTGDIIAGSGSDVLRKSDVERLTARSMSPPRSLYDVATARLDGYLTRTTMSSTSVSPSVSSLSSISVSSSGISNGKNAKSGLTGSKPKLVANTSFSTSSVMSRTPDNRDTPTVSSPFSPSPFSPGSNPRRTKSLHHPSPSAVTPGAVSGFPVPFPGSQSAGQNQPPPPPRRRPESIQVFRSPNETYTPVKPNNLNPFTLPSEVQQQQRQGQGPVVVSEWPPPKLASSNIISSPTPRRTSTSTTLTHLSEPTPSHTTSSPSAAAVFDTIQRTFSSLSTLKPGPGFESARIRAEGRVLPSGFSKTLVGGGKWKSMEKERLMDDMDDEDEPKDSGAGSHMQERGRRIERVTSDDTGLSGMSQDSTMDSLKIPMHPNEGWMSLS